MTKNVYAHGLIALLSAICLTSIASAQTGWWNTYGGPSNEQGASVQQITDGDYIITGWTYSFGAGGWDVYLVKTDTKGDTLWTRTYGGAQHDGGNSVQQTADGGYVIAGFSGSFGSGNYDAYLIKTDSAGDTAWTKTYGGAQEDRGCSVQQTNDGGYVIAGYTCSFGAGNADAYLIKTNSSGDTLWTRTYGGTWDDKAASVKQTIDGGYVITGLTFSIGTGSSAVYLLKTNASGDTLWTRTYGGIRCDEGHSVQQTSDGGYVIAGRTCTFGVGDESVYLIRDNASGETLWTRAYGWTGNDWGNSVQQTTDGGYMIAGHTHTTGEGGNVYLVKTNAGGDTLWTRTYGGTQDDGGNSVQLTSDGGYVIAGTTSSFGVGAPDSCNVYLIKTNANGNVGIEDLLADHPARPTRFLVQPNPFTSFARVPGHETDVFALSDVTGRQVAVCKGDRIGAGLRPGVYFLSPVGSKAGKAATTTVIKAAP